MVIELQCGQARSKLSYSMHIQPFVGLYINYVFPNYGQKMAKQATKSYHTQSSADCHTVAQLSNSICKILRLSKTV